MEIFTKPLGALVFFQKLKVAFLQLCELLVEQLVTLPLAL
jgi:hypothetical protein